MGILDLVYFNYWIYLDEFLIFIMIFQVIYFLLKVKSILNQSGDFENDLQPIEDNVKNSTSLFKMIFLYSLLVLTLIVMTTFRGAAKP